MTATAFEFDVADTGAQTRWSMAASATLHALLLAWLILMPHIRPAAPALTEIALIEPGELDAGAASPAAPVPAPVAEAGAAAASEDEHAFTRLERHAEMTPVPQSEALEDRIAARLATLQQNDVTSLAAVHAPGSSSALWGAPAASPVGAGGVGSAPLALQRGGVGGTGPPLELSRGGSLGGAPAVVPAGLPAARSAVSRPATGGDATATRSLAGALIAGPIADRRVITFASPAYPDWAKRDGVEGSVTLYFVVRSDGTVKENVLVQKTAGFEDFDESARSALRAWRFEPLREGRAGEQWGTITFHFRLREAG